MKLTEATTEEVATKTNAAYGLRVGDHLQIEQVLLETNVAYEMRSDVELVAITEDELRKLVL